MTVDLRGFSLDILVACLFGGLIPLVGSLVLVLNRSLPVALTVLTLLVILALTVLVLVVLVLVVLVVVLVFISVVVVIVIQTAQWQILDIDDRCQIALPLGGNTPACHSPLKGGLDPHNLALEPGWYGSQHIILARSDRLKRIIS